MRQEAWLTVIEILEHAKAVDSGHQQIENDGIEVRSGDLLDGFTAVLCEIDHHLETASENSHQLGRHPVVVDHQHSLLQPLLLIEAGTQHGDDGGHQPAIAERFSKETGKELRSGVHHGLLGHPRHQEDPVHELRLLHLDEIQDAESVQAAMNDEIQNGGGVLMCAQLLDSGVAFFDEIDDETLAFQRNAQDQFRGAVIFEDEYPFLFHDVRKYMLVRPFASQTVSPHGETGRLMLADTLLDSISQSIIATDVDGRIFYWNRAAEELYGQSASSVIGRTLGEVVPEQVLREPSPMFDELRAGRSWSGTRRNGGDPVLLTASPIRDEGGEITGFAIVTTMIDGVDLPRIDDGERKRLENRLLQAERVSSLGRLAGSVAHEFNNVLMGIQPFVDLLNKRLGADPTVLQVAPRIADAVARGKRITQEILRFTRIAEPSPVPVRVAEWLQSLGPELTQIAGADVTVTIEAGPSLTMLGDIQQLRQVFTNLAVNARHAMPNGGRLQVRAIAGTMLDGDARSAEAVHFTIRDTGVGMPKETLPYIFEPLFTTKKGGTGLGLAIASRVVHQHKGQIYAESTPGEGTTFHILIPAAAESAVRAKPEPAPQPRQAHPAWHVTLIEDDDSVGTGIAAVLDLEGISVDWVRLGAEAIERIAARFPDAVIFDVGLPDIDGIKLYEQIAARWPDLPVLFSTGHGDDNLVKENGSGKHIRYLQKPYEAHDLIRALEELLGF